MTFDDAIAIALATGQRMRRVAWPQGVFVEPFEAGAFRRQSGLIFMSWDPSDDDRGAADWAVVP